MHTSVATTWLTTTLLLTSSFCHAKPSSPTPPSPPGYFLLHEFGREFNSGHYSGFDEAFIFAIDPATDAKDMSTNNAQSCSLFWNSTVPNSVQGQAPTEWQTDDAKSTWSCRMDSYISKTEFRMGIRHQYRLNNLPCLKPNTPDCVTRLAYIDFNTSAPGFRYYDTKNSRSEHASGQIQAFTGVIDGTVYQHCKGCGGLGGGKQERYFP